MIIVEPWNDLKLATRVAEEAGAKAVVLASMVGGVKGADSYTGPGMGRGPATVAAGSTAGATRVCAGAS